MSASDAMWADLTAFSDVYTCYSSAIASWAAHEQADWPTRINPGLALTVIDAGDGLFGFAHFPAALRAHLGLERVGAPKVSEAVDGVLAELERSARVIVAGDGWRLPWHVAYQRRHVPHWFVLTGVPDELEAIDPFACRNELGAQPASRRPIAVRDLAALLPSLPGDDPVLRWRERLALGDDCGPSSGGEHQWFVRKDLTDTCAPRGLHGANAVRRLADHARRHAQDSRTYEQADDIWSIARHRAFLARHAAALAQRLGDPALAKWTREHGEPLAKRWSHMAPLLMQARLVLAAGRPASDSVAKTLDDLAAREQAAAQTFPPELCPTTFDRLAFSEQAVEPAAGNCG